MIALALLLALVQPADDEQLTPFSDRQPVRVDPLAPEQAFSAFNDVCVANFPEVAAFDRAAAAAGLGLVKRAEPQAGAQEWSSPHGHFVLRQATGRTAAERRERRERRPSRQRWRVRCDFWVALHQEGDVATLLGLIGQRLAAGRVPVEEIVGMSWDLGPDPAGGSRKLLFLPSIDDPRLFTLSLQRLADNPAR